MRDLAREAADAARCAGADYADARIVRHRRQTIGAEDQRIEAIHDSDEIGLGVRALVAGRWGFAATRELNRQSAARVAREAVELARASGAAAAGPAARLTEEPLGGPRFQSPCRIDPFVVSIEEKCALLLEANARMLGADRIAKANSHLGFKRDEKWFASSEGAAFESDIVTTRAAIRATAVGGGDAQTRGWEPPPQTRGWETIDRAVLLEQAARIASQAVEKLQAPNGSAGTMDLVLDPGNLGLTIHESVGHATELDRALGMEESLSGKTFATPDQLGRLRYGSPLVNFYADNTMEGGLASWGYDDEGAPAGRWDIVREGILRGYSTSRDTAPAIGEERSRGCCRADHWGRLPIVRIPNLCLAAGDTPCGVEDLIAGVEDGIYIEGRGSFSIDNMRLNFQFGGDAFWRIRRGKREGMLKNVTYQAITPHFWGSLDGLTDWRFWIPTGTLNCGKGDPGQVQQMTHGAPWARFRGVHVGGARAS